MAGLEHIRGSSLQKSAGAQNVAKSRIIPAKGFYWRLVLLGQQDAGHMTRNHQAHLSAYGIPTAVLARSTGFG